MRLLVRPKNGFSLGRFAWDINSWCPAVLIQYLVSYNRPNWIAIFQGRG